MYNTNEINNLIFLFHIEITKKYKNFQKKCQKHLIFVSNVHKIELAIK